MELPVGKLSGIMRFFKELRDIQLDVTQVHGVEIIAGPVIPVAREQRAR
jgi:hypothetical protein